MTKFYEMTASIFQFRLYLIKDSRPRKWRAKVKTSHGWLTVCTVNGGAVERESRKALIEHIRYAYEGKS